MNKRLFSAHFDHPMLRVDYTLHFLNQILKISTLFMFFEKQKENVSLIDQIYTFSAKIGRNKVILNRNPVYYYIKSDIFFMSNKRQCFVIKG